MAKDPKPRKDAAAPPPTTRAADLVKAAMGGSRTGQILQTLENSPILRKLNSPEMQEMLRRTTAMSDALTAPRVPLGPGESFASRLPDLTADIQAGPAGDPNTRPARAVALTLLRTPETLGQLVRQAREALGLSQTALADAAGVGRRFVSELENGKPSLELGKAMAVCAAAGLDLLAASR